MQPVVIAGEVGDSHVMIGSGLNAGEQVVTEGQFRLKPGSKVKTPSLARARGTYGCELNKPAEAAGWPRGANARQRAHGTGTTAQTR